MCKKKLENSENLLQSTPMSEDFTAESLKHELNKRGMKQKDLGELLDLTSPKTSSLMSGNRKISDSEQKLLKLYFYGIMPFEMLAPKDGYGDKLEFSAEEWRVIEIMAHRSGFNSASDWIVSQIRAYLAYCQEQEQLHRASSITNLSDHTEYGQKYRFYGQMAAGQPVETQLQGENMQVQSDLNPNNHAILEVNGESGTPYYNDGERWLVEIFTDSRTARKNKPAVFRDENGCYLKVYKGNGIFASINPAHKDVLAGESLRLVGYPVEKVID